MWDERAAPPENRDQFSTPPEAIPNQTSAPSSRVDPETAAATFLTAIGLDTMGEHLRGTPRRMARMYTEELFRRETFDFTMFPAETTGIIVQRDIHFVSVCAHHLVPFMGRAHIGYIPDKRMVGLSKLARTVEYFAHEPQVQERMTEQIADELARNLDPQGVAVVLEATHLCMAIRGVQKPDAVTVTSAVRGVFMENPAAKEELFTILYGRRS